MSSPLALFQTDEPQIPHQYCPSKPCSSLLRLSVTQTEQHRVFADTLLASSMQELSVGAARLVPFLSQQRAHRLVCRHTARYRASTTTKALPRNVFHIVSRKRNDSFPRCP